MAILFRPRLFLECNVKLLLPPRPCGVGDARSVRPIDKTTPLLVADSSLNNDILSCFVSAYNDIENIVEQLYSPYSVGHRSRRLKEQKIIYGTNTT